MSAHLQRAIDKLMEQLIALSARVEDNVKRAMQSLEEANAELAKKVINDDVEIDRREIDIEEECLKIFALHQPVAIDLRHLVAVLKINNDLERIGDLAQNISRNSIRILSSQEPVKPSTFDLAGLYAKVQAMLKKSLNSLVKQDAQTSYEVLKADDEVDRMHREMTQRVTEEIKNAPAKADALIQFIHIARHLERIADHATNIAEDVIYLIDGEIIRHGIRL